MAGLLLQPRHSTDAEGTTINFLFPQFRCCPWFSGEVQYHPGLPGPLQHKYVHKQLLAIPKGDISF